MATGEEESMPLALVAPEEEGALCRETRLDLLPLGLPLGRVGGNGAGKGEAPSVGIEVPAYVEGNKVRSLTE